MDPKRILAKFILASNLKIRVLQDYIAVAKFLLGFFLLDPGTYLRESKYFLFQEAVTCKISLKS
jgi:hypothetical protein